MKRRANWVGWGLHGVFGMLVGVVAGLFIMLRLRFFVWAETQVAILFIAGAALIGGGVGSRLGDRLWWGDHYRMIPPDEPQQSDVSDLLSWCLIAAGIATCVVAILRQLRAG
jgi:hypothetical protein